MAKAGRSSKFRHIFGEAGKPEKHYSEIKQPLTSGEGSYVCANSKFFAVARNSGGGPVYIRRLDDPGRFAANAPQLSVQKGKAWDIQFNPFIDNMIGTASDDCTVAVTTFPAEGLTENVDTASQVMEGHSKKVVLLDFNPSAANILASGAFDCTVKVWDATTASCVTSYEDIGDVVYSLKWNKDGSQVAFTSKDKKLRIFDPRTPADQAVVVDGFDGAKSSKCFWVPELNWVGSTGFSKTAKRQLKIWDLAAMDKPIYENNIDQAASILMPHYDYDNGVLYLAGKGEGNVQFYELANDDRKCHQLGVYRNPEPQKGGGWVPKKGLDVWKCEVQRFMKLTQKSVIPVSFIVPRKAGADIFQGDIFPDCHAGKPALSAEEWLSGDNADPVTMEMDPKKRTDEEVSGDAAVFVKKATYADLEKENAELKARVKELEGKLGISSDEAKDDA